MDNRYEVYATHGKGVFSSVLRARDNMKINEATGKPTEVAIKVIRANDIMFKAGQTETVILRKLGGADPEGKRHVIRLLRSFEYRSHLCLVFESMVRLPCWQRSGVCCRNICVLSVLVDVVVANSVAVRKGLRCPGPGLWR